MLLLAHREFKQRIDSLADRREPKGMAAPRAEKRQLVREACLHELAPFLVSAIEQESLGISSELIRQVLQQLAEECLIELRGRGRASRWVLLSPH